MGSVSSSETLATENREAVNLFNCLPNEIIELIFSHIGPRALIQNVLPVCRRFYVILSSEKLWELRLKAHPLNIRLCEEEMNLPDFSAVRTLDATIVEEKRRKNWDEKPRYVTEPAYGYVNAIKLFKNSGRRFCLSAFHSEHVDRSIINLWSVDKMHRRCKDSLLVECDSQQLGVIDDIVMHGDTQFLTNSEDTVKLWDIGPSAIREVSQRHYRFLPMHLSLYDQILACGVGVTQSISLLDMRDGMKEIALCPYGVPQGRQYITQIHLKENTLHILYSKQLVKADVRNLKTPLQTYEFEKADNVLEKHGYCSMAVSDGLIHCCHMGGEVLVLRERDLHPLYAFDTEHEQMLHEVVKSNGSIIALTSRAVRAFSLGSEPVELGSFTFEGLAWKMDALDGDVVVGTYFDGNIYAWTNDTRTSKPASGRFFKRMVDNCTSMF